MCTNRIFQFRVPKLHIFQDFVIVDSRKNARGRVHWSIYTLLYKRPDKIIYWTAKAEEVGQLISELSRELSTNEIALFSIVLSAEFGQKNLHSMENKSEKNINITIFLQNLKCCSTTTKDLLISAKICEVNFIFNVILMFEVSRLPTTC